VSFGSDFDRHARNRVIVHAVAGGFLGALPGAIVAFLYDNPSDPNRYVPTAVLAMGCLLGTLVSAVASATALVVALLRRRTRSSGDVPFVAVPPHAPKSASAAAPAAPVEDSATHAAIS
jgi:hypothetical protein